MTITFDYQGQIVESLYLRNGGPIDVKQKESKSIGFWVNNMILNFDNMHGFNQGISWSNFKKPYLRNGRADWYRTKGMAVGHLWPLPWPFGNQGGV